MSELKYIDSAQALDLITQGATVVDIRDLQSFNQGRIRGALHLNNDNFTDFVDQADLDNPILVCCYHGISSQHAGKVLIERDFDQVYSINGGFEAWRAEQPNHIETSDS